MNKPAKQLFTYNAESYTEDKTPDLDKIKYDENDTNISWLNFHNFQEKDVEKTGKNFGLHRLLVKDILGNAQRAKLENYGEVIYFTLKVLSLNANKEIVFEQISFVFGKNYVLSFQERPGDIFHEIRDRIRQNKGIVREKGPDYLVYLLLDAVIDNYYAILDHIYDRIEEIDDEVIDEPSHETMIQIKIWKKELVFMKKSASPIREALSKLTKDSKLVSEQSIPYYLNLFDEVLDVNETIDTYREMLNGHMEIYLSQISNRMNEVMKVLTIIATIFIPMTFIAGVYGMNFEYMPELQFRWAYPTLWGINICVFVGMLYYFKRKGWL